MRNQLKGPYTNPGAAVTVLAKGLGRNDAAERAEDTAERRKLPFLGSTPSGPHFGVFDDSGYTGVGVFEDPPFYKVELIYYRGIRQFIPRIKN